MSRADQSPLAGLANRRSILAGALVFAGLAGRLEPANAQAKAVKSQRSKTQSRTSLHQEIIFKAVASRIYSALLSSKDFTAFSGLAATIDPNSGGAFSLFGGLILGRNIELVADQRIVQAWRAVQDFPPGVYSLVKMELTSKAEGTLLTLDHTGFPPGHFDHLNSGWEPRYWAPLKKFLS